MSTSTLTEYLSLCGDALQGGTPDARTKRVATICLVLCKTATRTRLSKAPCPTDEQALNMAVNLLDHGIDCDDEQEVKLAWALAKSNLTLDQIARVAR